MYEKNNDGEQKSQTVVTIFFHPCNPATKNKLISPRRIVLWDFEKKLYIPSRAACRMHVQRQQHDFVIVTTLVTRLFIIFIFN